MVATILGAVYGALVSSKMAGVIDNSSVAFAVASLAGALLSIVGDLADICKLREIIMLKIMVH